MRKQPGQPPKIEPKPNNNVVTQVREYELITPLFGGGTEPGETDPVTIIRGAEIRGQLRFWWRACRGGQFNGSLVEMKQAEDRLWGKAYNKNENTPPQDQLVQILVEPTNRGTTVSPSDRSIPSYVAFPLLEGQTAPRYLYSGVAFRLALSFPLEMKKDIDAALWAWETFGGVGARTRRGFGAMHLLKIDGSKVADIDKNNASQWIRGKLADPTVVARGNYPSGLPHLSSDTIFHTISRYRDTTSQAIWMYMIDQLKNFRQSRTRGSTGRSNWPEAETIRKLTDHEQLYRRLNHPQKFPRAAFGLPIVFHFKDERAGDPPDTTLKSTDSERLASPLILRPFACSSNQCVGIAILLQGSSALPGQLILEENSSHKPYQPISEKLNRDEAQRIPVLNGQTNVLQAFMDYLGGNSR